MSRDVVLAFFWGLLVDLTPCNKYDIIYAISYNICTERRERESRGGIVVGESQLKVTRGYGKIAFEFVLRFGNCWVVSSLCCFDDKMPSGNSFGSQTTKHS